MCIRDSYQPNAPLLHDFPQIPPVDPSTTTVNCLEGPPDLADSIRSDPLEGAMELLAAAGCASADVSIDNWTLDSLAVSLGLVESGCTMRGGGACNCGRYG